MKVRWSILGELVEIAAPAASFLDEVVAAYARFPAGCAASAPTVSVVTDGARLRVGRTELSLLGAPWSSWHLRIATHQAVLAALGRAHVLPHGSAVRAGGRAVLILGGSGTGKTTLARALGARGLLLSCEGHAPIALSTGAVQPFPRALEVVAGSGHAGSPLGKIREAPGECCMEPLDVSWIVFLEHVAPGRLPQRIEVGCHRKDIASIRGALERAGLLTVGDRDDGPLAVIAGTEGARRRIGLDELYATLRASGACYVASRVATPPDFRARLEVEEVAPARALLGLSANSAPGPSARRAWPVLGELVARARALCLRGGGIEERADAVVRHAAS